MERLFFDISVIAMASAVLAWLAAVCRQPVIVAYVLCGVVLGPWGLGAVPDVDIVYGISHIGVALLLFMAGLVLHPQRLAQLFRSTMVLTLGGCSAMWLLTFLFLRLWGFAPWDCVLAALALMFSSTILITKLMPTTTLHQQHMGAVSIAILIAQDIIAVTIIILLTAPGGVNVLGFIPLLLAKGVALVVGALVIEQFVLRPMMRSSDRFNEVLVLLCLGWCLTGAVCSEALGLTYEVGAFVAGVAMARNKVALVLSTELRPVRDFFLVFFFFVLGAELDLFLAKTVWLPALLLAGLILVARPAGYRWLLRYTGEDATFAKETGLRMGQASEFALLIAVVAVEHGKMSAAVSNLVQLTAIVTMVGSAYIVVMKYPTPVGPSSRLLRD